MEEKVVSCLKEKTDDGIDLLIDTYSSLIYGVIYSTLQNHMSREDIEECYYDVIFTLWHKIDKYDAKKGKFKNWLISVAKFKAVDYLRKGQRQSKQDGLEDCSETSQSAEDEMLLREDELQFRKVLERLGKIDQKIFSWRYIDELSVEEIADQLHMAPQAVYTRISRGKGKLKKWMGGK